MINRNEKNIEDLLVIDDTRIPIQFYIQNWGLPFARGLLKKVVKIVLASDSLNILTINKIDISLELVQYEGDKSPTGMQDIEGKIESEEGEIITVVMSDRFSYTMENIVIKVSFKTGEVKCLAITPTILDISIEHYMQINHVEYTKIECK